MNACTAQRNVCPRLDGARAAVGPYCSVRSASNPMNFSLAWVAPDRDLAVFVATSQGGEQSADACDEIATSTIKAKFEINPD